RLLRRFVQQLHADADPEERYAGVDGGVGQRVATGAFDRVHARPERPDAGKDDGDGVVDDGGVRGEAGVGTVPFQRLLSRPEIADAVVENGDQWPGRHNLPLVDGRESPSTR